MKRKALIGLITLAVVLGAYPTIRHSRFGSCVAYAVGGFRDVATDRSSRFLGKVSEDTARCRGGEAAVAWRKTPWLDWPLYWSAGGAESRVSGWLSSSAFSAPTAAASTARCSISNTSASSCSSSICSTTAAPMKITFATENSHAEKLAKTWPQFRLPQDNPAYAAVGGDGAQKCTGELIRFRTLTGICNDILNPLMGSVDQPFGRNVEFEATFPELSEDEIVRNRHGDRLGLLKPDPQVISRKLFTRAQTAPANCHDGRGPAETSAEANCDYQTATHVNVLAAFWIQFMTHDWFSHLEEGQQPGRD